MLTWLRHRQKRLAERRPPPPRSLPGTGWEPTPKPASANTTPTQRDHLRPLGPPGAIHREAHRARYGNQDGSGVSESA